MKVIIDGVSYVPEKSGFQPGDYVVVDDISHDGYDVDVDALGQAGKIVAKPFTSCLHPGQLAVELPGYSYQGHHIFWFYPESLSYFEEDTDATA